MTEQDLKHLDECLALVRAEFVASMGPYPGNEKQLAATMAEAGEVADALLGNDRGKKNRSEVFDECIQLANMALRVALFGSAEFEKYHFNPLFVEWFEPTSGPKGPDNRRVST